MPFMQALRCAIPVAALLVLLPSAASAAPVCNTGAVTINKIEQSPLDGQGVIYAGNQNATLCVGPIGGNDSGNLQPKNGNIGRLNDGLLNGQGGVLSPTWFNNAATPSPLLDLDKDGVATDPGWIYLGKGTPGGAPFEAYTQPLDLASILNIEFACTVSDKGKKDCSKGSWSLATSLDIIDIVQDLLGRNAFDHLAFVLKAGNNYAIYDFDFNMLSAGLPGFNYSTPYSFTGTWNTGDLGNKDISHISVWARDPVPQASTTPNEVPEPGMALLVGLGLAGAAAARRRRA